MGKEAYRVGVYVPFGNNKVLRFTVNLLIQTVFDVNVPVDDNWSLKAPVPTEGWGIPQTLDVNVCKLIHIHSRCTYAPGRSVGSGW